MKKCQESGHFHGEKRQRIKCIDGILFLKERTENSFVEQSQPRDMTSTKNLKYTLERKYSTFHGFSLLGENKERKENKKGKVAQLVVTSVSLSTLLLYNCSTNQVFFIYLCSIFHCFSSVSWGTKGKIRISVLDNYN